MDVGAQLDDVSLESELSNISEMERLAQVALLKDGIFVYGDASAPDRANRICEPNNNKSLNVYKVDVKSVQKYLDDIGNLVDLFHRIISPASDIPPPQADLRFLIVHGSVDFPEEAEVPYTLKTKCSIDLSHTKFQCPIELIILDGAYSLDLLSARFEYSFEVKISDGLHLNIVADKASFEDEFTITPHSFNKKGHASLSIRAPLAFLDKVFTCRGLKILEANFFKTGFKEKALFRRILFEGNASFVGSRFIGGVLFDECTFLKAPDFHESELHQDSSFKECRYEISGELISDVAAFRVLKAHFGKMRDTKHELMFYALEHRAERKSSKNEIVVSIISWLYDEISEYGASIERSVKLFVLWNINFFIIYHLATATMQDSGVIEIKNNTLDAYPALILTLQNTFNPLALFTDKSLANVHSLTIYTTALFQSLGSITILALMLLAIRGRFRKGGGSDS